MHSNLLGGGEDGSSGPSTHPPDSFHIMLTEVVIDRKLLDYFKKWALRRYPVEYAMELWGTEDDGTVDIHALLNVKVDSADVESINFEIDPDKPTMQEQGLKLVGTIHTHPDGLCSPSDEDLVTDDEQVLGIMGIRKTAKRRFTSFGFFDSKGVQLELTVGE